MLDRNFCLISRRARALDFLMAPDSRQGALRPDELTLRAEIAPPQRELHQLAHLDSIDWL
jgi:hypothetical protein